jgi:hypothetical protein
MLDILIIKSMLEDCKKRVEEIGGEIREHIEDTHYVKTRIDELVKINRIMKHVKEYEETFYLLSKTRKHHTNI